MFHISEILDIAIRLETNGEKVYREAIRKVRHPELKKLLKWMSEEEAKHAEWFRTQKERFPEGNDSPILKEMNRDLLNKLIGGQSFSLQDVDFSKIEEVSHLMGVFLEFEKDTILFYEMLQPFIEDPETLAELEVIIDEENRHVKKLNHLIQAPAFMPAL